MYSCMIGSKLFEKFGYSEIERDANVPTPQPKELEYLFKQTQSKLFVSLIL